MATRSHSSAVLAVWTAAPGSARSSPVVEIDPRRGDDEHGRSRGLIGTDLGQDGPAGPDVDPQLRHAGPERVGVEIGPIRTGRPGLLDRGPPRQPPLLSCQFAIACGGRGSEDVVRLEAVGARARRIACGGHVLDGSWLARQELGGRGGDSPQLLAGGGDQHQGALVAVDAGHRQRVQARLGGPPRLAGARERASSLIDAID